MHRLLKRYLPLTTVQVHKALMAETLIKLSMAHIGHFRRKIRDIVSQELDKVVEDEPATVFVSKEGDIRSIKPERSATIKKYIAHLFHGYMYLDSKRLRLVSPFPSAFIFHLFFTHLLVSRWRKRAQLPGSS